METNNTTLEVTVEKTGEVRSIQSASLVSDVKSLLLEKRRAQTELVPWNRMSEKEQRQELDNMGDFAFDLIKTAVAIVATGEHSTVNGTLKQVSSIKDGVAKLVIETSSDSKNLMLINAMFNSKIALTTLNQGQFNQEQDEFEVQPDQPDLIDVDHSPALDEVIAKGNAPVFDPETDVIPGEDGKSQAWLNGYDAQVAGVEPTDSPYAAESLATRVWLEGFESAKAEADKGKDGEGDKETPFDED